MLQTASYPAVGNPEALVKKQVLEAQRKERAFDAKARTIGVDKAALDAQVRERALLRQLEQEREAFFDQQAVAMDQHAVFLQQQADQQRIADARAVGDYRQQFQTRRAGREWDINDPKQITKGVPARIGDADPRCGVSSLQQFAGEDLGFQQRKQAQAEAQQAWAQAQLEEKQVREFAERTQDRQFADRFEELNYRAWESEQAIAEHRKAANRATAEFNQQLARQKRQEALDAKRKETQDNWEEIRNALDSDLLTETLDSTLSATDPSRFKRYHMKGLLPEQRQAILNEQALQRDELQRRREQEAEEERAWAMAALKTGAVLAGVEDELRRQRSAAALRLREEQQQQAAVAAARRRQLDATYRNEVTEDFFGKFNQNSR